MSAQLKPTESFDDHSERLGNEITQLCGYINAATYQLLAVARTGIALKINPHRSGTLVLT